MPGSMRRLPDPQHDGPTGAGPSEQAMGDADALGDVMPGQIVWADLDPVRGREQAGRRPVLVVASLQYLEVVDSLALVVPLTTTDRGWPNHVRMNAMARPSWVMTEQIRAISRTRLHGTIGFATPSELRTVRQWLGDFLDLPYARR